MKQKLCIKDAQDKLKEIAQPDIAHLVPQQQSLMPDLLLRDMTARQVADLPAYLASLKQHTLLRRRTCTTFADNRAAATEILPTDWSSRPPTEERLIMPSNSKLTRRDWLAGTATAAMLSGLPGIATAAAVKPVQSKSVAAVITKYEKGLHADVLLGKILEGWKQDGGDGPALTLSSMYVDQFSDRDLARKMSENYDVPIFDTIEKAVTVGGNSIPVDGVISIGEHGNYPSNDKGQVLYPRRRFFEGITDTFRKYGKVVPVFSDKHIGPVWSDAKWIYDRAQQMQVPFMAGSSMTVGARTPEITIPMGCDIETAVGIGYSGLDIYGSHTLAFFQCHVERRRGAETGVEWVQCLEGEEIWTLIDNGTISQAAFVAALAAVPHKEGNVRESKNATLFLFQYSDGLLGAVFMLPQFCTGTSIALKLKRREGFLATRFDEQPEPAHPHFAWLLKGIERMVHTGIPSYPVERTLLTAGVLDRALTSRIQNHEKLMTPELRIEYQPVDYPHAPYPPLNSPPSR
jgi:hypothetical protein